MSHPIDKYFFATRDFEDGRKQVIAVSTYAGKTVKGTATCAADDEFKLEEGKKLAAARCEVKVANKRAKFAQERLDYLVSVAEDLRAAISKAATVAGETAAAARVAEEELDKILETL
jgi:hypothetical protein